MAGTSPLPDARFATAKSVAQSNCRRGLAQAPSGDEGPYGVLSYEDYEFDDDDEYSDDYEDPDEFAAEQADEADQYVRW